jgi:hypothetical protein
MHSLKDFFVLVLEASGPQEEIGIGPFSGRPEEDHRSQPVGKEII